MRSRSDFRKQRNFKCNRIRWSDFVIVSLGILFRYKRSKENFDSNTFAGIHSHGGFKFSEQFVASCLSAISEWIFVRKAWTLMNLFCKSVSIFSISCASSTTFAFLGEFHDARNRARVLMISKTIFDLHITFFIFLIFLQLRFCILLSVSHCQHLPS